MININKPIYDKRNIVGGTLKNNIKYALVNDKYLEKSFVSVCINIGSYANPKNYDGLAHFLEHMLFMGSKKYPDENFYSKRLNELGGSSNAYTATTKTVYFFNVFDNGLEEIIDVFSRFFIDPLFNKDSIDREMHAVNSEHMKNINNDMWRKYQLELHLTDKDSITNTFITGSLNTLNKPDIREKMIEFYEKYYTTDNISICVASSKNIEEQYMIIENTFGNIKKKESPINSRFVLKKPFLTENAGKTYFHKSLSDSDELTYIFEIPEIPNKDFRVLTIMLNNRSKNSLYFNLKNIGLITSINSQINDEGFLILTFHLTNKGSYNIEIINAIFSNSLKQILNDNNILEYAKYYQKIMQMNWKYLDKVNSETLCNSFSENHLHQPTKEIYEYDYTIKKLSNNYNMLFNKYLDISKALVIITGQKSKYNNMMKVPSYGTEYILIPNIKPITIKSLLKWGTMDNKYLDMKPKLIENLDKYMIPTIIKERQWYGACSKFGEPTIYGELILSDNFFDSPKKYLLTHICCKILNFLVNTILYKPIEVNFSIGFFCMPILSNVTITFNGLNDIGCFKLLLKELSWFLCNIKKYYRYLSKEYIEGIIKTMKQKYENVKYLNPSEYSSYIIKSKLCETEYENKVLLKELNNINIKHLEKYLYNLFDSSSCAATSIIYGNVIIKKLGNIFKNFDEMFTNSIIDLPKSFNVENIDLVHPNTDEKSNCITYYYYVSKFIPEKIILLLLATNILGNEFFDDIRTKNQLGYIAHMGPWTYRGKYYIIQKIQSDKSIKVIEEKMMQFNNNIVDIIKKCDLKKFIETLKSELMEPDYSIVEKISRYVPEISSREFLFERKKLLLNELTSVNIENLNKFIKEYIDIGNIKKVIIRGS